MTHFLFILLVLVTAGVAFAGAETLHRFGVKHKYFLWPIALTMAAVALVAYLWNEPAIYRVQGLNMFSPFGDAMGKTVLSILLFWFTGATMLINVLSVFFDYRTLKHMARLFSPLVILADLICLVPYLTAFTGTTGVTSPGGIVGATPFTAPDARYTLLILQLGLTLAISLFHILRAGKDILPTKREWLTLLYALPLAVICVMPAFAPQALFGFADNNIKLYDHTQAHRFVLYGALILPYLIYVFIRKKDEELKRFLMIYFSVGLLWVYLGRWTLTGELSLLELRNWPLHLCNTAMFLVPLCLIFRMQKLFNFCLFINVAGALMAMVLCEDLSGINALATERVSYWINHYTAFFMPVLLVALKIFRRPKLKDWMWAVIAFACYYVMVLILNPILDQNFFFINSADTPVMDSLKSMFTHADKLVESGGKWAVTVNLFGRQLEFFPLYQTLFFVIYVGVFTAASRFIYELLFRSWDKAEDRREREHSYKMMKKDLHNFLGGKPITEPITGDASPRIAIKHFSKKYGANKHYSVHDVSYEVNGGEIFGFLGPNGAGKSTIIKSIVGMQTITEGNIEVCGFDVDRQAVQAKMQIGFVPDHYALYENLTGREYINYIADLYRVSKEDRDAFIDKYVARFQLTHSFDNQMKTYSHGMKQKITIMAALVHNPKVWILDEPLTGLDPTSVYEVKECMKEHAAAGNIVFFSSHIIDVVENICDRIAIIKGGQLRACTSIADLEADGKKLEQFYLDIIYADDGDLSATEHAKGEANA